MSDLKQVIHEIIDESKHAPSPDNCKPWVYTVSGNSVTIGGNNNKLSHVLNVKDTMTWVSLGCLLYYMETIANRKGVELVVVYPEHQELFCEITFKKFHGKSIDVIEYKLLFQRRTNRFKFDPIAIAEKKVASIIEMSESDQCIKIDFQSELKQGQLEYLLSSENYAWHSAKAIGDTLRWVRFNQKKDSSNTDGMPWKTLGVSWWEVPIIFLLKKYPSSIHFLKYFLFHAIYLNKMKSLLKSSSGYFTINCNKSDSKSMIEVGRSLTRLWVQLTGMGLAVQPFNWGIIPGFNSHYFSSDSEYIKKNKSFFQQSSQLFSPNNAKEFKPCFFFRVGKSTHQLVTVNS